MKRIIDLSMPVHMDMVSTCPRVPPPALTVYESHEDFATRIGAAEYGVDSLTASYLVVQNDHVGTHLDARKHIVPTAGGPETIPLEYCISDGVLLDFTDKEPGYVITTEDVQGELEPRIGYTLKERDIVLNQHGAGAYNTEERYRTDHPGMSGGATRWLIEQGVRLMGRGRDHLRPAGLGDVREEAVLGGAPGHVGRGVLAPGEPDEPGADRPPVRLPAQRAADQVDRHDGRARPRRGDRRRRRVIEALVSGRVALDLYPEQSETALEDVATFRQYTGGFAANVATGLARLGVRTAVFSAVGDDGHGRHIRNFLEGEGIDCGWLATDRERMTALAFCELWPPDHFPITYHRTPTCPDWEVGLDDAGVGRAAAAEVPLLYLSGTGLARPRSLAAAEELAAGHTGGETILDLDWRPMLWPSPDAFAAAVARVLPAATVVLGGDAEWAAAAHRPGGARPTPCGSPSTARTAAASTAPTAPGRTPRRSRSSRSTASARATRSPPGSATRCCAACPTRPPSPTPPARSSRRATPARRRCRPRPSCSPSPRLRKRRGPSAVPHY